MSEPHPHAHHPIWKTVDKAVMALIVGGVIWLNSQSFDAGEVRSIVAILIGAFARDKFLGDKLS